eukprot:10338293-Karenia_brevis.AAC.1
MVDSSAINGAAINGDDTDRPNNGDNGVNITDCPTSGDNGDNGNNGDNGQDTDINGKGKGKGKGKAADSQLHEGDGLNGEMVIV